MGTAKLRLWARMVTADLHDFHTPPNVPAIGNASKKTRQMIHFLRLLVVQQ